MKYIWIILKIIGIALLLFLCKHLIQAFIEFTTMIPVKPRAYIWGEFIRSRQVFIWQFLWSFWAYILAVIIFYFILRVKFLKELKNIYVWLILSILIFMSLLYVNNFEFPIKKTYFPSGERINFALIEDFIIYSIIAYLLIYSIRKWLIEK
jgi:hypothetical protein